MAPAGVLFGAAISLGAFLLFLVQPLIARFVLPWFGGSAAVWTTCLVFFQLALVLGYGHPLWLERLVSAPRRPIVHASILMSSLLLLPIAPGEALRPAADAEPIGGILFLLARTVGIPYVLLASTGPLLQAWSARVQPGADPYRWFAVSNLASLAALVGYPLVVEPHLGARAQTWLWSAGYALYVALVVATALATRRAATPGPAPSAVEGPPPAPAADDGEAALDDALDALGLEPPGRPPRYLAPTWPVRALWLLLPACATVLLPSVTSFLTQDVAPVPLLWVVPLSLYVLSFVVCFARGRWYRRTVWLPLWGLALFGMYELHAPTTSLPSLPVLIFVYAAGLFVACVVLHGELARLRPPPRSLPAYYFSMAAGGALGGVFVGVVAPLWLAVPCELEIGLGLCAALVVTALRLDRRSVLHRDARLAIAAFAAAAVYAFVLLLGVGDGVGDAHLVARNFHGSLRVVDVGDDGEGGARVRKLVHGRINHGAQRLTPGHTQEPATYYCADSGVGLSVAALDATRPPGAPRRIGVLGLGAGAIAAWARPGDTIRFYEINPLVVELARREFSFLAECGARVEIVPGDARLSLEQESPQAYDLLVMDAFLGDSVPVHLLTREAFRHYWRHIRSGGVLAVNISNRHLDLEAVIAESGRPLGHATRVVDSDREPPVCYRTRFALQAESPAFFRATEELAEAAREIEPRPGFRPWTDDQSDLLEVMR